MDGKRDMKKTRWRRNEGKKRKSLTKMDLGSFFKTLIDHEVTVELKNDIQIRGTLKSVDQYLNIKLDDINVVEEIKYPHLVSLNLGRKLASPNECC